MSHEPIALLTADHSYRAVLVNWLITATVVVQPPVRNILVLSLDKYLYEMLKARRIPCIHVDPSTVLNPAIYLKKRGSPLVKFQLMIIRMTVLRLLNHWRFDVILYDIDALLMQNPHKIYQHYSGAHIIGSHGNFPVWIKKEWGLTLCTGLLLIRSSPKTGE